MYNLINTHTHRPPSIPPDYIDKLQSRLVKVKKGILPPTLAMILKTYYHLPAHQAPVTSPAVHPDDMMERHRDGEHNPLERPQASEKEQNMVADGTSNTDQKGDFVFEIEVGWTTKHRKSSLAISNWRFLGNNKGQQRREQIGGATTSFKKTSQGTRQRQQHKSPPTRRLQSASISEG